MSSLCDGGYDPVPPRTTEGQTLNGLSKNRYPSRLGCYFLPINLGLERRLWQRTKGNDVKTVNENSQEVLEETPQAWKCLE